MRLRQQNCVVRPITDPLYAPIFEKMAQINKPIWLHPVFDTQKKDNNITFSWEYELTLPMNQIVNQNYFTRFPELKIIVHHAGAMVPYFSERIRHIQGEKNYQDFKKFYVDTALLVNSEALQLAINFFGIKHVLFGTDTPLGIPPIGPTKVIQEAIEKINLTKIEKQQIFFNNWKSLLNQSSEE